MVENQFKFFKFQNIGDKKCLNLRQKKSDFWRKNKTLLFNLTYLIQTVSYENST